MNEINMYEKGKEEGIEEGIKQGIIEKSKEKTKQLFNKYYPEEDDSRVCQEKCVSFLS